MKLCLTILAVTVISTALFAQETPQDWPGFDVSGLSTLYVLDDTGSETAGRLLRLEPDSLVLFVNGAERRFDASRVRRIEKRGDSLRNGALIGAVVGAVFGVLGATISDCPGNNPSGPCPGSQAALFLVSTGMWAAIGTGIDALVTRRTTLYEAAPVQPATGRGSSAMQPSRGGGAFNLRFCW